MSKEAPGSPIASASRRVKKLPKTNDISLASPKPSRSSNSERLKFEVTAPKKLNFRRHSFAASSSLLLKESGLLFSPAYRAGAQPGGRTGSLKKPSSATKPRAKSVFVKSPAPRSKTLSTSTTTTTPTTGISLLPLPGLRKELQSDPSTEKKETIVVKDEEKKEDEKKETNDVDDGDDDGEDESDYYEDEEFDPFVFIKHLGPLPNEMKMRKPHVPKKKSDAPKITLALDLDETLVHCSVGPIEGAKLTFPVEFGGVEYTVYVRLRPHLKTFLESVSKWFEVVLFTASQQVYADTLMDILDPGRKYIPYRIFRDSCVCTDGNYLKDLHIIGRDMKHLAIVDNSVQAFGYQLNNGIPIESWFEDPEDTELLNLLEFLKVLKDVDDVRPLIRDTFRIEEFVNSL